MRDKFDRPLAVGDICFKVGNSSGRFGKPTVKVYKVLEFTASKVKIAERTFVDSTNLVKACPEDLERFIK